MYMLIAISLISLLIALPGFINKAGYSIWKGFIPFYNIYLFFRIIEFPPVILMLCGLGMIILPDRAFIILYYVVYFHFLYVKYLIRRNG